MVLKECVLMIPWKKKGSKYLFKGAEEVLSFERIFLFAVFWPHSGGGSDAFSEIKTAVP
jgi:hypothetical protein